MNPPDMTGGQFVFFILLAFFMMAALPFAKALLMYLAIRILKFQNLSYWKAFFCVLIGSGATMAVQTIAVALMFRPGQEFDPETLLGSNLIGMLLGLLLMPIAETVSLLMFFKETLGKTVGAIALTYLFAIALAIVLFLSFLASMFLVALVSA